MGNIAIIGGGNLGSAIASGLLKTKYIKPEDLSISKRNTKSLAAFAQLGVEVTSDNIKAIKGKELVLLCVKPYNCLDILQELCTSLEEGQILVSTVTGIWIESLAKALPPHKQIALLRAMPNTAIAIGESLTALCAHENVSDAKKEKTKNLFDQLGKALFIEEKLMDSATVLGACGIAYALRFIRANIQGGIEIGFDAQTASVIAAQTIKGAAELLIQTGNHPEQEIDKVTTPKGCTIAGINEMEHQGFSSSLIKGILASYQKISA